MRILITIIISAYFTSCSDPNTESKVEEVRILNQNFLELVGTNWYYEPLPIPPAPISEESTRDDSIKFRKDTLEYGALLDNRQLDTSVLKIYLLDTLTTYKDLSLLEKISSPTYFEANFSINTSWIKLVRKLIKFDNPERFDINQVTETGNYTLVTESEFEDTTDNKRRIGRMTMSRVALSPDNKRGVFYYTFTCGGLCGWGSLVFVERKGSEWKIIGQRGMWVS